MLDREGGGKGTGPAEVQLWFEEAVSFAVLLRVPLAHIAVFPCFSFLQYCWKKWRKNRLSLLLPPCQLVCQGPSITCFMLSSLKETGWVEPLEHAPVHCLTEACKKGSTKAQGLREWRLRWTSDHNALLLLVHLATFLSSQEYEEPLEALLGVFSSSRTSALTLGESPKFIYLFGWLQTRTQSH